MAMPAKSPLPDWPALRESLSCNLDIEVSGVGEPQNGQGDRSAIISAPCSLLTFCGCGAGFAEQARNRDSARLRCNVYHFFAEAP